MKRSTLWILSGVAAAIVLAGGARWASQRKTATDVVKTTAPVANLIELSASDVIKAQKMDMLLGLPVSGTLKASQSAMVKARAAKRSQVLVINTTHTRTTAEGGCWWEVAIPEVSTRSEVLDAHARYVAGKQEQRV